MDVRGCPACPGSMVALECPACHGRVTSVAAHHPGGGIRASLECLGLPSGAARSSPPSPSRTKRTRATADVGLFIRPDVSNVERLKAALRSVYQDPCIEEISADDLCGDFPAVRYLPPAGFGYDILTRLGQAFGYADLDVEEKVFDGVRVRVVTPKTLWRMKKDTVRPTDRFDADVLAERFGFRED